MKKINKHTLFVSLLILSLGAVFSFAYANHSWGLYHWARTGNPFTLKLGDNVSSTWDLYLGTAATDWSQSSVLDTTMVAGGTNPKTCKGADGRVEVCNRTYGNNGWLGIAQIWVSGSHITKGVVKMNDTYFNTASYNTPGWRSLVMCQEVGHTFGLGHQDENFSNTPIEPHTCMDYFVPGVNEIVHPNQHDYEQLEAIYAHLDTTTTIKADEPGGHGKPSETDLENPSEWGKSLKQDGQGRDNVFVRELGGGKKVFTHVFWIQE